MYFYDLQICCQKDWPNFQNEIKNIKKMKLAVVGATGLVGQEVLKVIDERNIEFDELYLIASAKSVGQKAIFKGKEYTIISIEDGCNLAADVAVFSAGGGTS